MRFLLEIITPERLAYSDEVDLVTAPTARGMIGVLAHHVPLFTRLLDGEVKITKGDEEYFLAIGGGFMEVTPKKVSILVSRAAHSSELNEAEIKKAMAAAEDALKNRAKGEDLSAAQAIMRRSLLDLKVLKRKSRFPSN